MENAHGLITGAKGGARDVRGHGEEVEARLTAVQGYGWYKQAVSAKTHCNRM